MMTGAKRLGKYPYQFIFNQGEKVFHHRSAVKGNNFGCKQEAMEYDSDMTFKAALEDTLSGKRKPCPHCLDEFPTTLSELKYTHFPDPCNTSMEEIKSQFS